MILEKQVTFVGRKYVENTYHKQIITYQIEKLRSVAFLVRVVTVADTPYIYTC